MKKLIKKIVVLSFFFNLMLIPIIKAGVSQETEKAAGNSFARALSSIPWRKIGKTGGAVVGGLFSATCIAYTYRNQIRKWTNTIGIWAAPYLGIKNLLGIRRLEEGQGRMVNALEGHSNKLAELQRGQWAHAEGQKAIQKTLGEHGVQFDRIRGEFELLQTGVNDIKLTTLTTKKDVTEFTSKFADYQKVAQKHFSTTDSRLGSIEKDVGYIKRRVERLGRSSNGNGVRFSRKPRHKVDVVDQEQTVSQPKLPITRDAILNETPFGNNGFRKLSFR